MTDASTSYEHALRAFHEGDYSKAFSLLMPFAEAGVAEAQCIIGNIYDFGFGRPRNEAEAIKWYERSSAQGYGVASNNLGTLAVRRGDLEAARMWYDKAEQQGFVGISKEERRRLGCL